MWSDLAGGDGEKIFLPEYAMERRKSTEPDNQGALRELDRALWIRDRLHCVPVLTRLAKTDLLISLEADHVSRWKLTGPKRPRAAPVRPIPAPRGAPRAPARPPGRPRDVTRLAARNALYAHDFCAQGRFA